LPEDIRQLAKDAIEDDSALERLAPALLEWDHALVALLGTTQAVDVVRGGVKVNALPERATAVVNHRLAEHGCVLSTSHTSVSFCYMIIMPSV
jgi:Gly-Xaa carboxypeptidase